MIEQLQDGSIDDRERSRLLGIVHFQSAVGHMARVSLWVTIRMVLRCSLLILRRFGFLSHDDMRKFRQMEVGLAALLLFSFSYVLLSMVFSYFISLQVVVDLLVHNDLVAILLPFGIGIVVYICFSRLFLRDEPRNNRGELRFRKWCVGCGYELSGLESALGDELWVGPRECPECGCAYPAVGE